MAGVMMARTVHGTVIEAATDEPIIGATVKCKEAPNIGVATDFDGKFTLNVPDDAKYLLISYVGMQSQGVPITSGDIEVKMLSATTNLDEVVVVGYGIGRLLLQVNRRLSRITLQRRIHLTSRPFPPDGQV